MPENVKNDTIEFKGFDDWVAIFRGGEQTDNSGNTHDGNELINSAIKYYSPDIDGEAPICLDHKTEGPSYGWVRSLKAECVDGIKTLFAKIDATDDLIELIKSKKYINRSAGFYPDGKLREVSMLGASIPAVKGLKPISLYEDEKDIITFNFEDTDKSKENTTEETIMPDTKPTENKEISFSEEIVINKLKEQKQNLEKEFNEKLNINKLEYEEKIKNINFEQSKNEIKTFLDNLLKDGKITPAILDSGVQDFCESLIDSESFNFNEKTVSKLEWFKGFLSYGDNSGLFTEFDNSKDRLPDDNDGKQELLIKNKMKEDNSLDYNEAFSAIQLENRELFPINN